MRGYRRKDRSAMSRASSLFVLLVGGLVTLLPACGDDAGPTIESRGEGPANERPLWVPRPGPIGPVQVGDSLRPSYTMSEDRLVGGRRVFAAGWQQATEFFESGLGPAEPYFVRFYGRHEDGIYLEGDTRAGLYDEPVLFVPSTVRVGMRWSHPPRWTFEVVGRGEGSPVTWRIRVIDAERRTTNPENTLVLKGEPYFLTFYEGSPMGPFWTFHTNRLRGEAGGDEPAWLWQDEVPPPAEPADVPELALRPLNGGEPIAEGVVPTFFGVVVHPTSDRLELTLDGMATTIENSGITGAFFVGGEATLCGSYDVGDDRVTAAGDDPDQCRDPRVTIIDKDDRVLRIPAKGGWRRYFYCVPATGTDGTPTCNPQSFGLAGIYRADDGTAMVFFEGRDSTMVAPHDGTLEGPMSAEAGAPWVALANSDIADEVGGSALWLPEQDGTGWSLLVSKRDGLQTVHVAADGRVDRVTPFRDEGGNLGLTTDKSGRRLLRTHPDGAIERILWDGDGVRRQPLARIGLEPNRVLVGAAEVGDRLLVLTLHDFAGTDPQYSTVGRYGDEINVGADRAVRPELGRLQLWEATLPASAPPPIAPGELTRLVAALDPSGSDAALCGFSGKAPLDGWTISGAPVIAFEHGTDGCITLVGDKARDFGVPGYITGRLPALGPLRMQLGKQENRWDRGFQGDNPYAGAVPLADGSGYAVCKGRDPGTGECVGWRIFDADWTIVAEDVGTPPPLAALPDLTTCATAAGATCEVHSLSLLDCRGPGASGPQMLPDPGSSAAGVPHRWVMDGCWPVEDTLWLQLHQYRDDGERLALWQVDTKGWTFTEAKLDAAAFLGGGLTPEGEPYIGLRGSEREVCLDAECTQTSSVAAPFFFKLRTENYETFSNLSFFGGGGVSFVGPMLFGLGRYDQTVEPRRLWRPDVEREPLAGCGDGVLGEDERCPEDWPCEPAVGMCEAGTPADQYLTTCRDDGLSQRVRDCTTVCESGGGVVTCHGSGQHCFEDACVPLVACGDVFCDPGESCVMSTGSPSCAVLSRCGDGVCEPEEDAGACADCAEAPISWDGLCTWAERWRSDCARCGDGLCQEGEGLSMTVGREPSCPADCDGCGDNVCEPGEQDRCPGDCPGCGNDVCEPLEPYADQADFCPRDCLPCEAGRAGCFREGVVSCGADGVVADYTACGEGAICVGGACVAAQTCGNGRCEVGEDEGCATDCGP